MGIVRATAPLGHGRPTSRPTAEQLEAGCLVRLGVLAGLIRRFPFVGCHAGPAVFRISKAEGRRAVARMRRRGIKAVAVCLFNGSDLIVG